MHVCVFLGSKHGTNPEHTEVARNLGEQLAARNITLVYGGGSVGLMGELARSVVDSGGDVIGVITHGLVAIEVSYDDINELIMVDTLEERKTAMFERSDAFVALPGGVGTLDEVFTVMSWNILQYHRKPMGILNFKGCYDLLFEMLEDQSRQGFIPAEWMNELFVAETVDDLLEKTIRSVE